MTPAHLTVAGPEATRTAYVLHGVFGAGHNFRSFIKRLSAERPAWRFELIDLRHHGHSQGAEPPNTLENCAEDLFALSRSLGTPPEVVIGHSFGGKVALAYARALFGAAPPGSSVERSAERAAHRAALRQIWTLDSNPGKTEPSPDHEVLRVLSALRATTGPFNSREAVVQALTTEQGFSSGIAQWLVTNLERRGDHLVWRFDLDAIGELLDDYFRQDFWPYLEAARGLPEHHLVVAERSDRWTGSMRGRARTFPPEASVTLHELPDAGHWVHVDNPAALLRMIAAHLPDAA